MKYIVVTEYGTEAPAYSVFSSKAEAEKYYATDVSYGLYGVYLAEILQSYDPLEPEIPFTGKPIC